jgi:hypothetical protein
MPHRAAKIREGVRLMIYHSDEYLCEVVAHGGYHS